MWVAPNFLNFLDNFAYNSSVRLCSLIRNFYRFNNKGEDGRDSNSEIKVILVNMNVSFPVTSSIEGVTFGFWSVDEIQRFSVKRIINPNATDGFLRPNPGGLYDPALGAVFEYP